MPRNLLIGAITNYNWDNVAQFFNSYVQAGFENCDCVMFTGNMTEETNERIRQCGVDVRPIPDELMKKSIINIRWRIFSDFLKENEGKYDLVLTADIRDVIFQRDLFKLCDKDKPFLGIALEDGNLDTEINKGWLVNAYGEEIQQAIKNNPIICVGTVWGTAEEFRKYSEVMAERLLSEWSERVHPIEQAVGNYIIYYEKLFDGVVMPSTNYDGYVMTAGFIPPSEVKMDSSGNILNDKGEIAAVVHQYDRQFCLVRPMLMKYSQGMSEAYKAEIYRSVSLTTRTKNFMKRICERGILSAVKSAIQKRVRNIRRKKEMRQQRAEKTPPRN